jgi:16S rRNA (cytidine1402-2'-O)-methyltransferase
VTTALAVSGLPSERFCFEGFAPRKQGARRSWLASLAAEQRTAVFFESPRRLHPCLLEEVIRGSLAELAAWAAGGVLGEITVVLSGAVLQADLPTLVTQVSALVDEGMGVKDACAQVISATPGASSRRELYDAVLQARRR